MKRIAAFLLLCPLLVYAQGAPKCLPAENGLFTDTASALVISHNKVGVCAKWLCYLEEFTPQHPRAIQLNEDCGTWAQMHLVGRRLQTMRAAPDPLKSLQTLPQRIKVVPLTDPSMAGMPK